MTYNEWIQNIADSYGIGFDEVSTSETATEYLAYCNPPSFNSSEINIVSLRINKSDITP